MKNAILDTARENAIASRIMEGLKIVFFADDFYSRVPDFMLTKSLISCIVPRIAVIIKTSLITIDNGREPVGWDLKFNGFKFHGSSWMFVFLVSEVRFCGLIR